MRASVPARPLSTSKGMGLPMIRRTSSIGKPVMAGFHRGMGGKETKLFDPIHIPNQLLVPDLFNGFSENGGEKAEGQEQTGVPFIEMIFFISNPSFFSIRAPPKPRTTSCFKR